MKRLLPVFILIFLYSFIPTDNGPVIKLNGKKLYYSILGDGKPAIVFLTGMGVPMQDMAPLQERISLITRTLCYDRAGIGRSEAMDNDRSIQTLSTELKDVLEKTGFTPTFIIVAHSRGAQVARYFANKYPDKVKGLILIDPSLPEIKSTQRALRTKEENAKADSAFYVDFTIESTIPAVIKNEMGHYPKADSSLMDTIPLPKNIPVTILASVKPTEGKYGEQDIAIKAIRLKELTATAPQTKLVLTEKSGHFIYEDEPGLVTNEIASMIKVLRSKGKK